jgi:hypothetical protein
LEKFTGLYADADAEAYAIFSPAPKEYLLL